MSLLRLLTFDSEKEAVVCYSASELQNNKLFRKSYERLFAKHPSLTTFGNATSDPDGYFALQNIVVLDDTHIKVINSLGIDAFPLIKFAIVPKDMLRCLQNKKSCIRINRDSVILNLIIDRYGISSDELKSLQNQVDDMIRDTNIKYVSSYNSVSDESDVSF